MLNPNCSEQVFRLSGSLEEVKAYILQMIEIVRYEYKSEGFLSETLEKSIDIAKQRVKLANSTEDLEEIFFPFTCNYETFFTADVDGILVSTCNNHDWSIIPKVDEYLDYWDASDIHYATLLKDDNRYLYFERTNGRRVKVLKPKEWSQIAVDELRSHGDIDIITKIVYKNGKKYLGIPFSRECRLVLCKIIE